MADDIRSLSAALARDPSSLQYVELAEALRRRGTLDEAVQVALHGLSRHHEHVDGFDVLGRIYSDRGQLVEARAAWERVLAIVPEHAGALKGLGFLFYRQGDTRRAADILEHAVAANPEDESARRALAVVRGEAPPPASAAAGPEAPVDETPGQAPKRPSEVPQLRVTAATLEAPRLAEQLRQGDPDRVEMGDAPTAEWPAPDGSSAPAADAPGEQRPPVFLGLEGATADMLLLDAHGLVMAGGLRASDGSDASELAAAALAGVSGEATRTAAYLHLGAWTAILAEAEQANVVLSPVGEGALLMLRRDKSTPVGLAVRIADRARRAAALWLERQTP